MQVSVESTGNLERRVILSLPAGDVNDQVGGRLRYANADACLLAAEAGLGLAQVPSFVGGPAVRAARVRRLLPSVEAPPVGVHAR